TRTRLYPYVIIAAVAFFAACGPQSSDPPEGSNTPGEMPLAAQKIKYDVVKVENARPGADQTPRVWTWEDGSGLDYTLTESDTQPPARDENLTKPSVEALTADEA